MLNSCKRKDKQSECKGGFPLTAERADEGLDRPRPSLARKWDRA